MKRIVLFLLLLESVSSINSLGGILPSIISRFRSHATSTEKNPYKCCGCIIDDKDTCALKIQSSEKCSDLCPTIFGTNKKAGKWDRRKRDVHNIMSYAACEGKGMRFCEDTLERKIEEKLDCMQLQPAIELHSIIGNKLVELIENHIDRKLFHRYGCKGDFLIKVSFEYELRKLKKTLEVIDKLKKIATDGNFSPALLKDPKTISLQRGVRIPDKIKVAAEWICSSSGTLVPNKETFDKDFNRKQVLFKCSNQVTQILQRNQYLFTNNVLMDNIRIIHNEFTALNPIDPEKYRMIMGSLEAQYGTIETGSFAQEYALKSVQPHWNVLEKAMFLLSSLVRAHGFIDCNGRAIRTVYALILINYDVPLHLPTTAFIGAYAMQ